MRSWEYDHAVGRGWCYIYEKKDGDYTGYSVTKYGYVQVFQSKSRHTGQVRIVSFSFVWQGRIYTRNIKNKEYTKIGLARIANAYAKEIVNKGQKPSKRTTTTTEIRI